MSCIDEDYVEECPTLQHQAEVIFSTQALLRTRTSSDGNQWVDTDRVGIFMLNADGTLPGSLIDGAENRQYAVSSQNATTGTTYFTPVSDADNIYYPQSGYVDFIACYPYKPTGTGGISNAGLYPIDVHNQSDPSAINLLYAKTTNKSKNQNEVNLTFEHILCKLTLNVTKDMGLGNVNFANLTATIDGMPATADFALNTKQLTPGSPDSFLARKTTTAFGYEATFEAILIPTETGVRSVTFAVGNIRYKWDIPPATAFHSGAHYVYTLTVKAT
jgi:hypothetical protein